MDKCNNKSAKTHVTVDLESGSTVHDQSRSSDSMTQATERSEPKTLDIEGGAHETRSEPSIAGQIKNKSVLDTWNKSLVTVPLTIAIALFGATWTTNDIATASFNRHVFFVLVTANFHASVVGIVLRRVAPAVARGLHRVSFLCVLVSITLLLQAIGPHDDLRNVPWFCLWLVLFVFGLVVFKLRSLP